MNKPTEQDCIDLGRVAYILARGNHPEWTEITDFIDDLDDCQSFTFKRGYFYEFGRVARLNNESNKFNVDSVKHVRPTWEGQTSESLLNEIQMIFDIGWDNPEKYGPEIYFMIPVMIQKLKKVFAK